MNKDDRAGDTRGRDTRGWRPTRAPVVGSAVRRLLWAVLGAVVYTLAYLAAKHFFGF